jgi:nitrate reductase delta subunit
MKEQSIYYKLVSILMAYPDKQFVRALPELASAAAQLPAGRRKSGVEAFLATVNAHSTLQLQERYTAAFEMNPATTLNITYHIWGDGEKRAGALSRLQQLYAHAGYAKTSTELPDYLPLMLEFLAVFPEAQQSEPFRRCFGKMDLLVDRLRKIAPPYAALLQPLAGMFKDQAAA